MVGDPVRSAKTLVVTDTSCLAKRIVFVLSYFIRCSLVYKQDLVVPSRPVLKEPLLTYRLDNRQETEVPTPQSPPLCQSHSSPTMGRVHGLAPLDIRRTRSFMAGEGDLIKTPREPWNQDMERAEKVNFLIGDNESLDIKEMEEEEEMSEEGSPGVRMRDDLVAKAVKSVMVEEVKENEGGVMVTELPILLPEVLSSQPAPLPSLMCCTPEYTPGTVLQVSLRKSGIIIFCRAATKLLINVRLGGHLFRSLLILKPAKDQAAQYPLHLILNPSKRQLCSGRLARLCRQLLCEPAHRGVPCCRRGLHCQGGLSRLGQASTFPCLLLAHFLNNPLAVKGGRRPKRSPCGKLSPRGHLD